MDTSNENHNNNTPTKKTVASSSRTNVKRRKIMVEDALIALANPDYNKNLNQLIIDRNKRETSMFELQKNVITDSHNQVSSNDNIYKL